MRLIRPRMRGWIHAFAVPIALVLGSALSLRAAPGDSRLGVVVFTATAVWLFAVSSVYNIGGGRFTPSTEAILMRVDHASIFVLIAGSCTGFALVLLHGPQRGLLLALTWTAAGAGITFRVFTPDAPRWVCTPVYVGAGGMAVFFLPAFAAASSPAVPVLILVGGILYCAGAVVYVARRPNPWPRILGFHEVFHGLTVLAFLAHFCCLALACTA